MTTETMIERVARAICVSMYGEVRAAIPCEVDNGWSDYIPEARAALQALREPTEDMERAAFDVLEVAPSPLFATGTLARNAVFTALSLIHI